jgi:hypothetical protein
MCALVGLLLLLGMAPTITLWAARIRPPHFGSITGRDLFRRGDGSPVDTVSPVDEDGDEEPSRDIDPVQPRSPPRPGEPTESSPVSASPRRSRCRPRCGSH